MEKEKVSVFMGFEVFKSCKVIFFVFKIVEKDTGHLVLVLDTCCGSQLCMVGTCTVTLLMNEQIFHIWI